MSRTMKIRKLKLFYFQKNARYRKKILGNLSLNEGKISVGLPVFYFRILVTSRENQESEGSFSEVLFDPGKDSQMKGTGMPVGNFDP